MPRPENASEKLMDVLVGQVVIHLELLKNDHAFAVDIGWTELAARIPLLYMALIIPSLGNFGTRELAWAGLFSEFGSRDQLIAYAFAVNSVFLVLNVIIGVLFLKRSLELISEVRRAKKTGEPTPARLLRDPTDL